MPHTSVLSTELMEGLALQKGDVVVDATVNGGGHAEIASRSIGRDGVLIGLDLDRSAIERARMRLKDAPSKVFLEVENYRNIPKILERHHIDGADKIYFDLGLSSDQLDDSGRGFSFKRDEPLLMTFSEGEGVSAADIVNGSSEKELADILFEFGEERFSRRIAKAIIMNRKHKRITTTTELSQVIEDAVPASYRHGKIHPATRTFQALRIRVNDELGNIKAGLPEAFRVLKRGGRMGVISFHSLEDRIVKNFFREAAQSGLGRIQTKKPLIPGAEEIAQNPRSRSSKLRIFEKTSLL